MLGTYRNGNFAIVPNPKKEPNPK
ncbi:hypothetical protein JL09_g6130 [Pichia kudriavzevii]|uniref:Uncharacterized protein n=1 Tax=Pichia kudriavzevii TaxID=4909 RepID=A0A099NS43_PICKU|nr:hypothetical protein JL09_g6130 [Pichia kudriavzevii]